MTIETYIAAFKVIKMCEVGSIDGTKFSRWQAKMTSLLGDLNIFYALDLKLEPFPKPSKED